MRICLDQRTGNGCGAENPDGATACQQCGRPLDYALKLHNPGTLIGAHYRIVHVIGYGGFGAVYAAEDVRQTFLHTRTPPPAFCIRGRAGPRAKPQRTGQRAIVGRSLEPLIPVTSDE